MTKCRNSFHKRQREIQKKQKADEKRARRAQIKLDKKAGIHVAADSSDDPAPDSDLPPLDAGDEDEDEASAAG